MQINLPIHFFSNSKSHQSLVTWHVNSVLGCHYGLIFIKAHKITLSTQNNSRVNLDQHQL